MTARRFAACCSLVLVLLASGCGFATRLAYNHLDWLAFRQLDNYVDLSRAQETRLAAGFDDWWRWHRSQALPAYARDLRALAATLAEGPSRAQLRAALDTMDAHYDAAVQQLLPAATELLASLSDDQVATMLATLDEGADDYDREHVALSASERRERAAERATDSLEKRLGRLQPGQRQHVINWSQQREDLAADWSSSRRAWRERFAAALATRADPGFGERLRPLFVDSSSHWTEAHRQAAQRNLEAWVDMLHAVLSQRSARQERRLREVLIDHAEDFERLARQPHD